MDMNGIYLMALLTLAGCACVHGGPVSRNEAAEIEQMIGSPKLLWLERKLREDIERELEEIHEFERQLMGSLNTVQTKKRQLEIKKRQPVQCLVNIVSCWKRK